MMYEEAVKAKTDGALITDGEHVYKIIKHTNPGVYAPLFTIQRQTLGIPFKKIKVDLVTIATMWRLDDDRKEAN